MRKKIEGFEDYEVSNDGKVFSLERKFVDSMGRTQNLKEKELSQKITKTAGGMITGQKTLAGHLSAKI